MPQISVTLPPALYRAGQSYGKEFGYRNVQEVMADLLRRAIFGRELEECEQISREMREGKNVVKFKTKKEALEFLEAV